MWRAREAIATTNLEAVAERENGLLGSLMTVTAPFFREWMCRVESQEAEMRILWSSEKTTDLTPALCVERVAC